MQPAAKRFRMTTRLRVAVALMVALAVASAFQRARQRAERAAADRREVGVRAVLRDEPLTNVALHPVRNGWTGLLFQLGVRGPYARRGARALTTINPMHPVKGLTRAVGPTIDACRRTPDGVPADLFLSRTVPAAETLARLGPPSARYQADVGAIPGVEFSTYGRLDLGTREGAIVVVRVR